eukprot:tig00000629_g2669.t1
MSRPPSGSRDGIPSMPPIPQAQSRPPSEPQAASRPPSNPARRPPIASGTPTLGPQPAPGPSAGGSRVPSPAQPLQFDPVAKLAELERRLLAAREELRRKRDLEFMQREQSMRERLERLAREQEEEREERGRSKERIAALQREVERRREREAELEQRALAAQREEREEQVARWLEAVRSELARREAEQVAAMRRAMERRGMGPLPAALDRAGLPPPSTAPSRPPPRRARAAPREEPGLRLMAQRAAERETGLQEAQERVRALNARRGELLAELEGVEGRRRVHAALEAKGPDFLLDLELGNAPPRDYVLHNIRKQAPPAPRQLSRPAPPLAAAVEAGLREQERRLAALREEAERLRAAVERGRGYRGELGVLSYSLEQRPLYYMCRELAEEAADGIWAWLRRSRLTGEDVQKQRAGWEEEGGRLQAYLDEQARVEAERAIFADALAETIGELGGGVHRELRLVFDYADALVHSLMARAIRGACGKPPSDEAEATVVKMLRELRRRRDETAARQGRPAEAYRHSLRLQPSPHASATQVSEEERRKAEEAARKKREEEESWIDPEALVLRWEDTEGRVAGFGADADVAREVAYFERVGYRPFTLRCEADGHSVARGSPNGRLLALGGWSGGLWVYDIALAAMLANLSLTDRRNPGGATIAGRECLLRRPRKSETGAGEGARITEVIWSADGTGLVSLTTAGVVRMYSIAPDPAAPRDSIPEDGSYIPPPLWPLVELTAPALGGLLVEVFADETAKDPQKKPRRVLGIRVGEQEDGATAPGRPTCLAYHPALTLMATQPAFVCGLRGGDVVKSNTVPLRKVIHGGPPSGEHAARAAFGPVKGAGRFLTSHEVFTGHRVEVRAVGFRGASTDMVTVDARAHVFLWRYTEDALSFFGCFTPVAKYRLDMTYHTFEAAGPPQPLFPPRTTYVPDRVEPGTGFERAMRAEQERIAKLELARKPHLALRMGPTGKEFVFPLRADVEEIEARRRRRREAAAAAAARRAIGAEPDEALLAILRDDDGSGGEGGPEETEGDLVKHEAQRFRPCVVRGELVDCRLSRARDALALTVRFGAHGEEPPALSTVLFDFEALALRPRRLDVKPSPKPPPSAFINPGPHPCPPLTHTVELRALGSSLAYVAGEGCIKAYSLETGAHLGVAAANLDDPEVDEATSVDVVGRHRFLALAYSARPAPPAPHHFPRLTVRRRRAEPAGPGGRAAEAAAGPPPALPRPPRLGRRPGPAASSSASPRGPAAAARRPPRPTPDRRPRPAPPRPAPPEGDAPSDEEEPSDAEAAGVGAAPAPAPAPEARPNPGRPPVVPALPPPPPRPPTADD